MIYESIGEHRQVVDKDGKKHCQNCGQSAKNAKAMREIDCSPSQAIKPKPLRHAASDSDKPAPRGMWDPVLS